MVRLEQVSKDYKSNANHSNGDAVVVHALKKVSLEIHPGGFTSLAGPSGSGKTTMLNLIGCLDVPDQGKIFIEDELINDKNKNDLALLRRHKIGFIFQSFNLIPVLSAYENVSFALSIMNMAEKEIKEKTETILEEVGLTDMMHRRPNQLSGGQQQRVAIARALVKQPLLILADEPTANLDSKTGEGILKLMEELNEKHRSTFVFSTHDKMVMDFAHRLILLHDGEIVGDERRK
jgi:putative ABC transport system ATP-binding protein